MTGFLLIMGGMLLGYMIPMLTSLIFSMLVGKMAPRRLSAGGRIKGGFVVVHGLVWMVAAAGAGYLIGMLLPDYRWSACVAATLLLSAVLIANSGLMKKQQGPLQLGGMLLATAGGFAGGLGIYLKIAQSVTAS